MLKTGFLVPSQLKEYWKWKSFDGMQRPFVVHSSDKSAKIVVGVSARDTQFFLTCSHKRRIDLEDKAKVVASDWGTKSLPR